MTITIELVMGVLLAIVVLDFLAALFGRHWAWPIEMVFGVVVLLGTVWTLSVHHAHFGDSFYPRYSLTVIAGSIYLALTGARFFLRWGEEQKQKEEQK